MAQILLKLDGKYVQRHASVTCRRNGVESVIARADDAVILLNDDARVANNQFAVLQSLVEHGITIVITPGGQCSVIMKT